jgi:hypothetical protein
MPERRLYVNSRLQKIAGDDTQFTVDLGTRVDIKRLVLLQLVADNLFTNFYDEFADFTYQLNAVGTLYTFRPQCDFFVTRDSFVDWFNANQGSGNLGFALMESAQQPPEWEFKLRYSSTLFFPWRPVGAGWKKLGFETFSLTDDPAAVN